MKYTKPKPLADPRADDRAILNFLDSLPDRPFEIVQPGMTQVRWPEWLTRRRLEIFAERGSVSERDGALKALAAIAPEEKKKLKMVAWKNDILGYSPVLKPVNWGPEHDGWRKVGECEVDT